MILVGLEVQRYFQISHDFHLTQQSQRQLERQVSNLTEEIDAAQTGQYRDAMARRMGYVQKTEVLYPIAQNKTQSKSQPTP